ncbi:alcohol dehydrogenase (NADP+) [Reichenbachiella agariperforans]|uniref:Alcohol dehydrogenase (NADP+) n=1 Tax=Reichenbachiella agariperforans TaxID=156994 RepID=A0A1M6UBA1_REIAG|nr:aldo/keto reductase [Reichenbachiella agariperforans]SHK66443.1 alcohol dehydrogenase (NADP+) [Reichenbachiella agariperforans]
MIRILPSMKQLSLYNDQLMPALGLGTWKSQKGEVYTAIRQAIAIGYRHFDCAPIYGNEKEIGTALHDALLAGDVTRKELWITSKVWNTHHRAEDVIVALKRTLADVQLGYLDLYLIHWPAAHLKTVKIPKTKEDLISLQQLPLEETWQGMEECVLAGLTRHIGVSNFSTKKIKGIQASAKIKIAVNQVEAHPYFQQKELLAYCQQQHIALTAYAPLGAYERASLMPNHSLPFLSDSPIIQRIADQHDATVAQVLLAWGIQRGTAVIPKSTNPDRLLQNYQAADLSLSTEDMDMLARLDSGYRYERGSYITLEGSPYTAKNLWDE